MPLWPLMKTRLLLHVLAMAALCLPSCVGTYKREVDPNTGKNKTEAFAAAGGQYGEGTVTVTAPNGTVTTTKYKFWDGTQSFRDLTRIPIATGQQKMGAGIVTDLRKAAVPLIP